MRLHEHRSRPDVQHLDAVRGPSATYRSLHRITFEWSIRNNYVVIRQYWSRNTENNCCAIHSSAMCHRLPRLLNVLLSYAIFRECLLKPIFNWCVNNATWNKKNRLGGGDISSDCQKFPASLIMKKAKENCDSCSSRLVALQSNARILGKRTSIKDWSKVTAAVRALPAHLVQEAFERCAGSHVYRMARKSMTRCLACVNSCLALQHQYIILVKKSWAEWHASRWAVGLWLHCWSLCAHSRPLICQQNWNRKPRSSVIPYRNLDRDKNPHPNSESGSGSNSEPVSHSGASSDFNDSEFGSGSGYN